MPATPLQDLKRDWRSWRDADAVGKLWLPVSGLAVMPLAFGAVVRAQLHLLIYLVLVDIGSIDDDLDRFEMAVSAKPVIREPRLDRADDLFVRTLSAGAAMLLLVAMPISVAPETPLAAGLVWANFGFLAVDPLLGAYWHRSVQHD